MNSEEDAAGMTWTPRYNTEAEIDEVILRLDLTLVKPDDDDDSHSQQVPASATCSPDNGLEDKSAKCETKTSRQEAAVKTTKVHVTSHVTSQPGPEDDRKKSKPLDFIRKLRQTDSHHRSAVASDAGNKRKSPEPLKVGTVRLPVV